MNLHPDYVEECFLIEGENLYWKARPQHHFKCYGEQRRWNRRYAGKLAGTIKCGTTIIRINGKTYPMPALRRMLTTLQEDGVVNSDRATASETNQRLLNRLWRVGGKGDSE